VDEKVWIISSFDVETSQKHASSFSFRYDIVTLLLLKSGTFDRVSWKPILLL